MIFDRTGCFEGDGLIGLTSLPRLITLDRLIPLSNGTLASQGGDSASSLSYSVAEKNRTAFRLLAALMQAYRLAVTPAKFTLIPLPKFCYF